MPIYAPKKAVIPEWVSEPSVMDLPYKQAIGKVARLLGMDQPSLPTPAAIGVVGSTIAKQAPKRAADELVELLMGRSKRVPEHVGLKPLSEMEAKFAALEQTRTHTLPPPPTELRISPYQKNFKVTTRILSREPGITKEFRQNQKIRGLNPDYKRGIGINSIATNGGRQVTAANRWTKRSTNTLPPQIESTQNLAKLNQTKVYTSQEIKNMMEGPRQALKKGLISEEEFKRVMQANQAKIDASNASLNSVKTLAGKVKTDNVASDNQSANFIVNAIKAGLAQGASIEDIANKYKIPLETVKRYVVSR